MAGSAYRMVLPSLVYKYGTFFGPVSTARTRQSLYLASWFVIRWMVNLGARRNVVSGDHYYNAEKFARLNLGFSEVLSSRDSRVANTKWSSQLANRQQQLLSNQDYLHAANECRYKLGEKEPNLQRNHSRWMPKTRELLTNMWITKVLVTAAANTKHLRSSCTNLNDWNQSNRTLQNNLFSSFTFPSRRR